MAANVGGVGPAARRVMHVISSPAGFGGAERVVQLLVRDQVSRGEEVTVVNPFCRTPDDVDAGRAHYAPARFEGTVVRSPADLVGARRLTGRALSLLRPQILHSHLFHAAALTATLRASGAIRVLTHHHGPLLLWRGDRAKDALDRWTVRRSDAVIAVSAAVHRHLTEHCGAPPSNVRTIRNGWEGPVRPHVGSPSGTQLVSVAHLRPEKGHPVLLQAMTAIRAAEPSATLTLVGDGPLEEELREQARALGLGDSVRFAGHVDDVWDVLAHADAFVSAAHQEPLGIAVLEAMAADLPVVATAVGGVPEIAPPGTALLVPPGEADLLASAVVRLLRSPELRSQLRAAGRLAAARWTSDAMVRSYAALYDELDPPGQRGT